MYCPNCGKDCGSAKFCIGCGTKLGGDAKQPTAWTVGQPCPFCGGTQLEGDKCAFCGVQLAADMPCAKSICPPELLGAHAGEDGYLLLREKDLIIKNAHTKECVIPYESIVAIKYYNATFWYYARITIRWEGNTNIPFPEIGKSAWWDETSVYFKDKDEAEFIEIYHAIMDMIQKNISD